MSPLMYVAAGVVGFVAAFCLTFTAIGLSIFFREMRGEKAKAKAGTPIRKIDGNEEDMR